MGTEVKNERMYNMCFYYQKKAFGSVQYPVLLKWLYETGVDGEAYVNGTTV